MKHGYLRSARGICAVLLFLAIFEPLSANDGVIVSSGGGLTNREGGTKISIQREDITLSYERKLDLWHVSASYILHNPTEESVKADISFVNHINEVKEYPGAIKNFQTWFNDAPLAFSYKKQKDGERQKPYISSATEQFSSSVSFSPGHSRVTQEYDCYGYILGPGRRGISYSLLTSKQWEGPIRHFSLRIKLPDDSIVRGLPLRDTLKPYGRFRLKEEAAGTQLYIARGGLFATVSDFSPEENLFLEMELQERYLSFDSVLDGVAPGKMILSLNSLIRDKLKPIDFDGFTTNQLGILHNAMYAIYGAIFDSPELTARFQRYVWYLPDPDFKESAMPDQARKNLELIKRLEKGK